MDTRRYSHARYDELLNDTIEKIKSLSQHKGGEYAGDDDRLANFRRNAEALGLQMEQVWAVYCAKHWDAVMQYIKDLQTGKQRTRLEPIDGRVDDIIVYMLLLKAMLEERATPKLPTGLEPGATYPTPEQVRAAEESVGLRRVPRVDSF